jgi:hypothetical protein
MKRVIGKVFFLIFVLCTCIYAAPVIGEWRVLIAIPDSSSTVPCDLFVGEEVDYSDLDITDTLRFTRMISSQISPTDTAPVIPRIIPHVFPEANFQNVQTSVAYNKSLSTITLTTNPISGITTPYNATFSLTYELVGLISSLGSRNYVTWFAGSNSGAKSPTIAMNITLPSSFLQAFTVSDINVELVPAGAVSRVDPKGYIIVGATDTDSLGVRINYPAMATCTASSASSTAAPGKTSSTTTTRTPTTTSAPSQAPTIASTTSPASEPATTKLDVPTTNATSPFFTTKAPTVSPKPTIQNIFRNSTSTNQISWLVIMLIIYLII